MYCPKCGWKNADDATKCANCSADMTAPAPARPQPTVQMPPQPPPPAQYTPQQVHAYPPPAAAQGNTSYALIGLILGIASFVLCPILFGGAGIVLGIIGLTKGEKLGLVAIIVSACCVAGSYAVRLLIFSYLRSYMPHLP